MLALHVIFWTAAAAVAYAYAGYPLLVRGLAALFGRAPVPPRDDDSVLPAVTLLVAAYNEEAVIADRVRTALAMDYPADKLTMVVASDGSTDSTAAAVRAIGDGRVRVLDFAQRRGKSATLNAAIAAIDADVLMLSDANTVLDRSAARRLARWFLDPAVGSVCGRLVLTDPASGRNADGLYWRYETFLKQCEAKLDALLGSNGAIYAFRRADYVPMPDDTIVDDFVVPLLMRMHNGRSIVYETTAVAYEETADDVRGEFRRRARIGAGGFQAIALLWPLMHPRWGWLAMAFVSHKALRWLCPFALAAMLLASAAAAALGSGWMAAVLAAQLAFYVFSILVQWLPARFGRMRPLRLVTLFTGMNAALAVGFWRWTQGIRSGAWERTARPGEPKPAA